MIPVTNKRPRAPTGATSLSFFAAAAILSTVAVLTTRPAQAQIVAFNTFGPGNAYDSGLFQQAAGPDAGQTVTAFEFTSAATGIVNSYDSVFQFIAGSPANISILLYANDGGKPGTLLDK